MFVGELSIDKSVGRKLSKGGMSWLFKFKCKYDGCSRVFGIARAKIPQHTGLCKVHEAQFRMTQRWKDEVKEERYSVEHLYKSLVSGAKQAKRKMTITPEELERLTKIKECKYCGDEIPWFVTAAYFLDRINNDLGYDLGNVVVCCTLCNYTKADRFDAYEMLLLGKLIGLIKKSRKRRAEKDFHAVIKMEQVQQIDTLTMSDGVSSPCSGL